MKLSPNPNALSLDNYSLSLLSFSKISHTPFLTLIVFYSLDNYLLFFSHGRVDDLTHASVNLWYSWLALIKACSVWL